jgi:DNA modification methylase
MDINKIFCANVFDLIEEIPDNFFDLIVCDGPYGVTEQNWDKVKNIQDYNLNVIKKMSRILKDGGALYLFGKSNCIDFINYSEFLNLKSKIVWFQPSRLSQGKTNYTNNYDLICYFIKGKVAQCFNLDDIRVPQLVELEHRKRCENVPSVKEGKFNKTKFNILGKNPGNVWGDIKQLTYKSKELLNRELLNTIQKPIKLIERIILASSNVNDLVFDPFCGSGTVPVVCVQKKRNYVACEINKKYVEIIENRIVNEKIKLAV